MFRLLVTIVIGFAFVLSADANRSVELRASSVTAPDAGEHLNVTVTIRGGKDIVAYALVLVFDATALKYIDATQGKYFEPGGLSISPAFDREAGYVLNFSIGESTLTGKSIETPLFEDILTIDEFFIEIPDPPPTPPPVPFLLPDAKYWAVVIMGSAPLNAEGMPITTSSGDGDLVQLNFEVVDPKRTNIALTDVNLESTQPRSPRTIYTNPVLTLYKAADVNGDDAVNILDLVFVAQHFGQAITADNRAADVNGDWEINILDLVRVAQYFGN